MSKNQEPLPLPDKKIPTSVMIIGTFQVALALFFLFLVIIRVGQLDIRVATFVIFLLIYGAVGAGLMAIQEWARSASVVLHVMAIPYTFYTSIFLGASSMLGGAIQLIIALAIIYALTRPEIRHKFQTVVPKKR